MNAILQMLRSKIIPWTKSDDRRLVTARRGMDQDQLPPGTSLSPQPIRGEREVTKKQRKHANQRLFTAYWPEANLQELALPRLACLVDGPADYLLGDHRLHASEGTFILIPPHMPHQWKGPYVKEGECTFLFAYTYEYGVFLWFSRSIKGEHINNVADNYLIPNSAAVQIFNLLFEEAVSDMVESEPICKSLLFAFFTILSREIEAGHYMSPVYQERAKPPTTSRKSFSDQVQEYIRANLHKRLKVEDAAGHMYMSSSHFSRTLRQKMGISFVELLTRCRIERAKELLKETDWTVNYIAGYVGLKSTPYFHELFFNQVGCTPIEYREK